MQVRETVPDWVVDEAGEAVFADLTPRALRNRIERGVVYAPEKARRERILICLTGSPSSAILIRRGKRLADYLQADCIAVHVSGPAGPEREAVERHMSFARNLRIDTQVVDGPDVAAAIANFARSQRITQIFMGRPGPRPIWKRLHESVVQQVVRQARDKQITIVAQRG